MSPARAVKRAEELGVALDQVPIADLQAIDTRIDDARLRRAVGRRLGRQPHQLRRHRAGQRPRARLLRRGVRCDEAQHSVLSWRLRWPVAARLPGSRRARASDSPPARPAAPARRRRPPTCSPRRRSSARSAAMNCSAARRSAAPTSSISRPSNRPRTSMDHFHYNDGILHAEDVALPAIAEAVGTPVYVYSAATFRRHARVFRDGAERRSPHASRLCDQGQSQPRGAPGPGRRRLWRRRRLGRRDGACAGGGHPRGRHRLLRRRQDPRRTRPRAGRGDRPVQPGAGGGGRGPGRARRRSRACARPRRCASTRMSMPAPTPRSRPASARTSSASRSIRRAAMFDRLARARRPRSARASPSTSAASSQTSRRSRRPIAASASWSPSCARAGHAITRVDLGGGLGVPYRPDDAAAVARRLWRDGGAR